MQEDELIQSENSASIFNTLSDIPTQIEDPDVLLQEAMRVAGSLTDVAVKTQRCKHLAYLIADQGQLLNPGAANLSKVVLQSPCGIVCLPKSALFSSSSSFAFLFAALPPVRSVTFRDVTTDLATLAIVRALRCLFL